MKRLSSAVLLSMIGIPLLVSGCGSFSIWPFGESKSPSVAASGPENATEYRCDAGKSFHVRVLEAGKSVWLILPDRQVRLDKSSAAGDGRYTNGIALLSITSGGAELTDGPISYAACKVVGANK
jgi:membrane-bound inhibitor of C-type lysozyme